MTIRFRSLAELDAVAGQLIDAGSARSVWLFNGPMGAGKTTLIKAVCRQLGVVNTVQSPTFSIVNEYVTGKGEPIYHFDCYRLRDEEEALDSGLEEYIDSGERCLIEWPERIAGLLPPDAWTIHLAVAEGERILETN
ncbi:tRNA (adenosine(37)-N6)-threonylcarbamoyltransferase complex ATPase subunit type 1 TsaE [Larkinella rosea]|uniref:tRNA threonylcarbamoyladenosine biosynthesis protein TsaE n=1 Tax=Larkinella rosea TaxID=2025312 RepID=A0A3P1BN91_9BACT|nr:tRNA (adenosine(37)-N6)-threonylcarbamoyltransferase complex ATPase subunit type 1 TsaE [Larkinella rosea]RRB02610.1 tRNA (adenosine(37)-N6)-threonylcarbamoyltransferase complex ATPase subunit type 1 TsaE [Larkinella rosea]